MSALAYKMHRSMRRKIRRMTASLSEPRKEAGSRSHRHSVTTTFMRQPGRYDCSHPTHICGKTPSINKTSMVLRACQTSRKKRSEDRRSVTGAVVCTRLKFSGGDAKRKVHRICAREELSEFMNSARPGVRSLSRTLVAGQFTWRRLSADDPGCGTVMQAELNGSVAR